MSDQPAGSCADSLSNPPPRSPQRWLHYLEADWFRATLLIAAAVLTHFPALSGELIWDDSYLAHDNPFIKSPLLILEIFRHYLFLDSFAAHYRPVQNLSFLVDYFFWNDNPYGFHLTNVFLHAGCATLLYFLMRRIFAPFLSKTTNKIAGWIAFLVALLWVVHPVHSAAVDYISGRADSLAFFFAAGGWLLFLRAGDEERARLRIVCYGLGAGSWLLALCSRETACLWLVIFALYILFFAGSVGRRKKVLLLCGCLALFAIYGGLRQLPEERSGAGPKAGWSIPVRTVLAFRALGDYGRLLVWPANLHMERTVVSSESYRSDSHSQKPLGADYLSILGLLCAALLIVGCCWHSFGRRLRLFGVFWFIIGFLPVSNLFELNATVAEHWLYLPSVGLLLWLAGAALDLPQKMRPLLAGCAGIAVFALSFRSVDRSSDWVTAEHFYERTLAAGGDSTRVHLNLGQLYAQRGEYARAEAVFRRVLARLPDYPIAQNNLANALFRDGKKKEAEALFAAGTAAAKRDRAVYPRTWLAAVNLAGIEQQKNNRKGALKILEQTRKDYPGIWEIVSQESELVREMKGPQAAIQLVSRYARDHWWHYGAFLALGRLQVEAGEAEEAIRDLQHASRLDIHEVEALNLIARMRMSQNRLPEAYRAQKMAVARQPDAPRQYVLLSDILEKMGQTAEAKDAIAQITRLQAIGRESHALPN